MIEQNSRAGIHAIGIPVIVRQPECRGLCRCIGTAGSERCVLGRSNIIGIAEALT